MEKRTFNARIYEITGKSFICPDNTTKKGDLVIAFDPLKQVDPAKMYAYVVDSTGETQSVSRKYLKLVKKVELSWNREMFMTHNQEVATQYKVMAAHLMAFILEKNESEQRERAGRHRTRLPGHTFCGQMHRQAG
jgi:hypothetical protein